MFPARGAIGWIWFTDPSSWPDLFLRIGDQ